MKLRRWYVTPVNVGVVQFQEAHCEAAAPRCAWLGSAGSVQHTHPCESHAERRIDFCRLFDFRYSEGRYEYCGAPAGRLIRVFQWHMVTRRADSSGPLQLWRGRDDG